MREFFASTWTLRQHYIHLLMTNSVKTSSSTAGRLRHIPKVELHRHLECSFRISTLRDLAPAAGLDAPSDDNELKRKLLITEPSPDLESALVKFLATQKLLHCEENLTRLTFEAIEDAANEGIRILELRFAPTYAQLNHAHLSFEKIHRAIAKGVEQAKHLPIAVGLIVIIQRTTPLEVAAKVTDFAIANSGKKTGEIIALDLADSEAGFQPRPFAPLFAKAKKAGLHITVHSGEADVPEAAGYVREAIELLGAERIGHGVQIYKDPLVMKFVADQRVPLELCPTSNWLTSAVRSTALHPFRFLMEKGLLVTLNSDDPGVFDIDLTNEYDVLEREHGFTAAEFERINDIAASASFIPLEIKQKHWPRQIDCSLAPLSN